MNTLMKTFFALLTLAASGAVAQDQGQASSFKPDEATLKQMKTKADKALKERRAWLDKNMSGWPEKSKEVAALTIDTYGEPQAVTPDLIVWTKSGPWKRTVLYRQTVQHDFPMPHFDILEQTTDYAVPADKYDDLAEFDGALSAQRTSGELSARCDKEAANFLAVNLARDVSEGKKSVDQARDQYANTIKGMLQGKKDPYLEGIKFEVRSGGDPGKARFQNPMKDPQALRP